MAQLIDIQSVVIDPERLTATVRISEDAPLFTGDDVVGTNYVYDVVPGIVEHVCLGDAGRTFGDALDDTELAHLLEHVTVELLAQTGIAGDISAGRTRPLRAPRTFEVQLACPDDVLVAGALSSAAWILDWAYTGGGEPEPDVDAIVRGLVNLVEGIKASEAEMAAAAPAAEPESEAAPEAEAEVAPEAEDVTEPKATPETNAEAEAEAVEPEAAAEEEPAAEPENEAAPEEEPEVATEPAAETEVASEPEVAVEDAPVVEPEPEATADQDAADLQ